MGIIAKHKIIEKYKNENKLMEISQAKEENLLRVNKIKMGFSVEDAINKLKQKDFVTITGNNAFKEGTQQFITSVLTKLFGKSALGTIVQMSASFFNPALMCDLPKEKLQERWRQLLKHLIVLGVVVLNQCDKVMAELTVFKDNDVKKMQCSLNFQDFL